MEDLNGAVIDCPVEYTEKEIVRRVGRVCDIPNPTGPAGNPFGAKMGQTGSQNVLAYNGEFPEKTVEGQPIGKGETRGDYLPAQHMYEGNPIRNAAHMAQHVLDRYDLNNTQARYVVQTCAGAFGFKIGAAEHAARNALTTHFNLTAVPRTLTKVADDEKAGVDLRLKTGDGRVVTFQVKTDADGDSEGSHYLVSIDTAKAVAKIQE